MSLSVRARALSFAVAAAVAPYGAAQPAPPDPAAASAPVPPVQYRSLLAGYRSFADVTPTPWRQANDTAAAIGGWRAYAREASEPVDRPATAAPASPAPASAGAPASAVRAAPPAQ